MNRLRRTVLAGILSRNCLNCAYLCRVDEAGIHHPLTKHERDPVEAGEWSKVDDTFWFAGEAVCFHEQWKAKSIGDLRDTVVEAIDRSVRDETSRYTDVHQTNDQWLDVRTYWCRLHTPFDPASSKPLKRLHREQDETRDNRRFWIPTIISAVALGISGLGIWRPWE